MVEFQFLLMKKECFYFAEKDNDQKHFDQLLNTYKKQVWKVFPLIKITWQDSWN